jgi:hypothetical protein
MLGNLIRNSLLSLPIVLNLLTKVLAWESSGGIASVGKDDPTAIAASDLPLTNIAENEWAVCHIICISTTEDTALVLMRLRVPGGSILDYSSRSRRNRMGNL